jgi:hypothetical protein
MSCAMQDALVASLTFTYKTPVALTLSFVNQIVSSYCQLSPGVKNHPFLRIIGPDLSPLVIWGWKRPVNPGFFGEAVSGIIRAYLVFCHSAQPSEKFVSVPSHNCVRNFFSILNTFKEYRILIFKHISLH